MSDTQKSALPDGVGVRVEIEITGCLHCRLNDYLEAYDGAKVLTTGEHLKKSEVMVALLHVAAETMATITPAKRRKALRKHLAVFMTFFNEECEHADNPENKPDAETALREATPAGRA